MVTQRHLFYNHVAQTTPNPIGLEISRAEGIYMFDIENKRYVDLISGVAVSNVGHCHPRVVDAIKQQVDKYLHLMVYGEYIQSPQTQLAKALCSILPESLNNIYYVNSGSEAVEGALKLAKRYTGRSEIISMQNSYHGSTHGALSLMGNEDFRYAFRPLLPDVKSISFNNQNQLEAITEKTACVILDPLQSENGLEIESNSYLKALHSRCKEMGALLVFDEVQTGFGRTGTMFYYQQTVEPDILVLAKAMGGGMPIGAFISSKKIMQSLTHNPALGHITTFGGHPVSAAAALASLEVIVEENLIEEVENKGKYFVRQLNSHPRLLDIRQKGLFIACDLSSEQEYFRLLEKFISNGLVTDSFLYKLNSFRIAPPLTITYQEIDYCCQKILKSLDELK